MAYYYRFVLSRTSQIFTALYIAKYINIYTIKISFYLVFHKIFCIHLNLYMLVFISKTSIDVGKMMLDEAKVLERKEDPARRNVGALAKILQRATCSLLTRLRKNANLGALYIERTCWIRSFINVRLYNCLAHPNLPPLITLVVYIQTHVS